MDPRSKSAAVLRLLAEHGPEVAGMIGARLWPNRRGRGCAAGGGGDYAAQMLLGRLRKRGLVRVASGDGSSRWELTLLGRAAIAEARP